MDDTRKKAIEDDVENSGTKGGLFDYVDTAKLERLGIEQYKPVRGDNFFRIIAPHTTGFFRKKIWIHSNIGVNNRTFLCLRKSFDEPCPVCEYREKLKEKDSENAVIAELYPGRRYLLFGYDVRCEESEKKGLRWFDCPPSLFEDTVKLSKDKRGGEVIDVSDPKDGRDIEFEQNKVSGRIRYESIKLVPTDPLPDGWSEDVPEYDDVLLKPTYEELERSVTGVPDEKTETSDKSTKVEKSEKTEVVEESSEPERKSRGESRRRGRSEEQSAPVDQSVKDRINEIRSRHEREDKDES